MVPLDEPPAVRPVGSVLVTGASGFVGRHLCRWLASRGLRVRAMTRQELTASPGIEPWPIDAIDDATDWTAALAGMEAVVHLAARVHVMRDQAADPLAEFRRINVAGTSQLARSAVAAGVRRFVFVSSIKVNGEHTDGRPFTEADVAAPQDPYAISKWEAECALASIASDTAMAVVVLRPPLVYGAGVKGNLGRLMHAVTRGLPLPLGAADKNRRSLLYVENLTDAIALCLHASSARGTYLLSDGNDLSTADLVRGLASGLNRPARLVALPEGLMRILARWVGREDEVARLFDSLQVDSGRICRELNWRPPISPASGLAETARAYGTEA